MFHDVYYVNYWQSIRVLPPMPSAGKAVVFVESAQRAKAFPALEASWCEAPERLLVLALARKGGERHEATDGRVAPDRGGAPVLRGTRHRTGEHWNRHQRAGREHWGSLSGLSASGSGAWVSRLLRSGPGGQLLLL